MKNKSVAFFLAFIGGAIGLHRFYLNNTKKGMIYLIFFWTGIPRLLSLADMVMILSSDIFEFDNYLVSNTDGRNSFRNRFFQVQPITSNINFNIKCNQCGSSEIYQNSCNYCRQDN